MQAQFLKNKEYIKEIKDEDSARELNDYWKDDSTYYPQPDSISFQDKSSVKNWNSDRKPFVSQDHRDVQHIRHGSVQAFYRDNKK